MTAKLPSDLSADFYYAPTVEIVVFAPNPISIRLDQLLAFAPESSPLQVGKKVIVNWTYENHKRVALRFMVKPVQGAE